MPAARIEDGCTREDVIPGTKLHPEVRIVYRPVTGQERRGITTRTVQFHAQGEKGAQAIEKMIVKTMVDHLVSWDLTAAETSTADGSKIDAPLEITAENVSKLEANLFEKIYAAVCDYNDEDVAAKN